MLIRPLTAIRSENAPFTHTRSHTCHCNVLQSFYCIQIASKLGVVSCLKLHSSCNFPWMAKWTRGGDLWPTGNFLRPRLGTIGFEWGEYISFVLLINHMYPNINARSVNHFSIPSSVLSVAQDSKRCVFAINRCICCAVTSCAALFQSVASRSNDKHFHPNFKWLTNTLTEMQRIATTHHMTSTSSTWYHNHKQTNHLQTQTYFNHVTDSFTCNASPKCRHPSLPMLLPNKLSHRIITFVWESCAIQPHLNSVIVMFVLNALQNTESLMPNRRLSKLVHVTSSDRKQGILRQHTGRTPTFQMLHSSMQGRGTRAGRSVLRPTRLQGVVCQVGIACNRTDGERARRGMTCGGPCGSVVKSQMQHSERVGLELGTELVKVLWKTSCKFSRVWSFYRQNNQHLERNIHEVCHEVLCTQHWMRNEVLGAEIPVLTRCLQLTTQTNLLITHYMDRYI